MEKREFRSHESYEAEEITRNMLADFVRVKGFVVTDDERKRIGVTASQTLHAVSPSGDQSVMRIKLCWRRITNKEPYSATQLLDRVKNDDWEGTLDGYVNRAKKDGITHFLFVQREHLRITIAALVPVSELVSIWCAERDISKSLIEAHKLGRKTKNHAMNGASPTLYLQDLNAPTVPAALWNHAGVIDLVRMPASNSPSTTQLNSDDTFDDLPGLDLSLLGSDGAPRVPETRSYVKRDQRVRTAVLRRAGGRCERCRSGRDFSGFLDVHHILGAERSDRVWNCVALCPNCHREAHAAPNCEEINQTLLKVASSLKELHKGAASASL